jgi:NADH-quinone oxidoreductase subunit N
MNFNPSDLAGLLPALILAAGALVLLTSEVFLRAVQPAALGRAGGQPVSPAQRAEAKLPPGSQGYSEPPPAADRRYQAWLAAVFAALAFWAAVSQMGDPTTPLFSGSAVNDAFGRVVSAVVCASLLLSCLVSFGYLEALRATRGEFYALALFSASGMCLLGQATDLIVIFISLEVMSLAVYCLSAYLRRGSRPAEAAFKYFVLGSFASAMFLYGAALAYGATGSTRLGDVAGGIRLAASGAAPPGTTTLLFGAAALLAAGFAFKVAAVPFHMWVPDVYDGAPAPVTGFMAAAVKVAAFATLVRILVGGFGDPSAALGPHGWQKLIVWLAALTMIVGNVLAIPQRSVKRMLAYSSIAHAGYLLVAVAAMAGAQPRPDAVEGLLFYLAAYGVTVIGAFGVVAVIERKEALAGTGDDLSSWAGLSERHPGLAAAMSLFMVSLAGIPPTAGFMAKVTVFRAAISADLVSLAVLGVLTSVGGLYYYLRVVVYVYMVPQTKPEPVMGGRLVTVGIALASCAVLVLWMGIQPDSFARLAQSATTVFSR